MGPYSALKNYALLMGLIRLITAEHNQFRETAITNSPEHGRIDVAATEVLNATFSQSSVSSNRRSRYPSYDNNGGDADMERRSDQRNWEIRALPSSWNPTLGHPLGWSYVWNASNSVAFLKRISDLKLKPSFLRKQQQASQLVLPKQLQQHQVIAKNTAVMPLTYHSRQSVSLLAPIFLLMLPWINLLRRIVRAVVDDWNFKGFGWSFYKSVLIREACGVALRIPLSLNFASWDRHSAVLPSFSSSVGLYYPWMTSITLTCSIHMQLLRTILGLLMAQLRQGTAFLLGTILRTVTICTSTLLYPLTRLWTIPEWERRYQPISPQQPPNFSTSSASEKGAPTAITRSSSRTSEQRIGISWSWRFSLEQGFEFRISYMHLYMQTILYVLENVLAPRIAPLLRELLAPPTSPLADVITPSLFTTFCDRLRRRTAAFGLSTSYPIQDLTKCSCSAMLSLSGFRLIKSRKQQQRQQRPMLKISPASSNRAEALNRSLDTSAAFIDWSHNENAVRLDHDLEPYESPFRSTVPASETMEHPMTTSVAEGEEATALHVKTRTSSPGSKVTS